MPGLGVVIMVGPARATGLEALLDRAIRASVLDLLAMLAEQDVAPVIVAGPDLDWLPEHIALVRDEDEGPFHFGTRLAALIERYMLPAVLYFGAGSTPLLGPDLLELLIGMLDRAMTGQGGRIPSHVALTNNLHSSDWVGISHVQDALSTIRRADRDNSLAWMLQNEADYDVRTLAGIRPVVGVDLDTPSDLAIVRRHPHCPPQLRGVLQDPLLERVPVDAVVETALQEGSQIALIGRVAPQAWRALSNATQAWIRVYSEERGMVASGRLAQGDVRSLLFRLLEAKGPQGFFADLAQVADAAILDSRVLMAAAGHYAPAADRFASDVFLVEAIADPWVRTFTQAAAQASIPVLLGGHGVVGGGLHVLVDIITARRKRR